MLGDAGWMVNAMLTTLMSPGLFVLCLDIVLRSGDPRTSCPGQCRLPQKGGDLPENNYVTSSSQVVTDSFTDQSPFQQHA